MTLEEGSSYAVQSGDYVGEVFIFVRRTPLTYDFLSIPVMENRYVNEQKMKIGIDEKILDFIEKVPRDVFEVVKAQFEKNMHLTK